MSKPKSKTFKEALLMFVDAKEAAQQIAIEAAAVQQRAREAECKYLKLQAEAITLWKHEHPDHYGSVFDHIILPSGRMAHIQEGAITVWELKKL